MTSPPNLRRFTVTETREAMVLTAGNLDEVARWCGGETWSGGVEYGIHPLYVRRVAHIGTVLVTDGSRWWDVSREEFERASEQWTEETT